MPKIICAIFAAVLVSLAALPAAAHSLIYTATLAGGDESPPNGSLGTGFATITFDLDLVTMHVEASFAGLSGTTAAAHIHCCFTVSNPNAIVATTTPSFPGFPAGVTSGSYDQTFDMALASSYNAAFVTANGGTVSTALNALLAGAAAGTAYFNIHTAAFPAGEIRGNLVFNHEVPEPAAFALVSLALGGLALRRRAV